MDSPDIFSEDSSTSELDVTPDRGYAHRERETASPSVSRPCNGHVRRLFDGEQSSASSSVQLTSRSVPSLPRTRAAVRPAAENQMEDILKELRQANTRLMDVTNRLDMVEGRLKGIEEPSTCSTSTGLDEPKKRKVPPQVRHLVRDIYKTLLEQADEFVGFDLKKRYTDRENQTVMTKLIQETQAQDSTIPIIHIRDSVRRFFQSKLDELSLKSKGMYDKKVQRQRRRNRIMKKLEARKSALERTSAITNEQKEQWRKVLVPSFISSEESGEEEIDGDVQPYLYVKILPWRDRKVSRFMKSMDDKIRKNNQCVLKGKHCHEHLVDCQHDQDLLSLSQILGDSAENQYLLLRTSA